MEQLNGPQLFLRYAWPCAEDKLRAGKISEEDFHRLEMLVKGRLIPPIKFLEHCFPNAVQKMREFAKPYITAKLFNYWIVKTFWREHHSHEGDCAVVSAIVGHIGQLILVCDRKENIPVLNPYEIEIGIGDLVYVHRRVICEKVEVQRHLKG